MSDDLPVLVVGGGPTGTTLASILANRDVDVTIVDAAPGPERESSRATTVHALTLEQLDGLDGAGAEIAERAARAACSSLWSGTRRVARVHWGRIPSRYAFMANLPQVDTEAALRARLETAGGSVSWGRAATNLAVEPDRVRVELEDGVGRSEVSAHYVVGCDGAHSAIRERLGVPMEGTTHEDRFLLADVDLATDLPINETHAFLSSNGVLGIIAMPGGRFRLNGTLAEHESLTVEALPELMSSRLRGHRAELGAVPWLAEYRTHARLAARYRVGRVLLAGDSAHLNSPVGGQGMNLGIQDALNLGWKLARVVRGEAPEALLDTYEAERRPIAARVLRFSEINTRMFTARGRLERVVRNNVMRVAHRLPPIQAKLALEPAGLTQRYGSGAVAPTGRRGLTGRRMPDIALGDPPRRLHSAFPRLDDTLLILDPGPSSEALVELARRRHVPVRMVMPRSPVDDDSVIADPTSTIARTIGRPGAAIVVRPDGFVGWCGTAPDDLDRYLNQLRSPSRSPSTSTLTRGTRD